MTTEITVYNAVKDPVQAMTAIGNQIMDSGLFGCKTQAQGQILALECMATKLPPLSMAKRYDLIHGRLSMKSQTMLADFRTLGGETKMIEKSPERAAIWMKDRAGNDYSFELTWEEAKQETFPYAGKESEILAMLADGVTPPLNPKYATPRSRGIMLWNRLISDSVRTIAPEISCGQYTPDEIEGFAGNEATATRSELPSQNGADWKDVAKVGVEEVEVEDAEFNVRPDEQSSASLAIEMGAGMAEAASQAVEPKLDFKERLENTNDQRTTTEEDGLASEQEIQGIKNAINQWTQLGGENVPERVKGILDNAGGLKLKDLTISEAAKLRSAIDEKTLEIWLEKPLRAKNDTSQS